MQEDDPNLVPHHVNIHKCDRPKLYPPPEELKDCGYTIQDEMYDAQWIEQLAAMDPERFGDITGYCVPTQLLCDVCGHCTPDVQEMTFNNGDGSAYTRTIIRCHTDTS